MSQTLFATRLPESMCKYIRYKALHTGKQQQELVAEIIASYQQQDTEFMAKFKLLESDSINNAQETTHDA